MRAPVALGVAAGLGALAMSVVLFAPMQRSVSVATDSTGRTTTTSDSETLLASQGAAIVVFAALPVVLALLPLVAVRLRRVFRVMVVCSTGLVGLFVLATGFSIGLLYVPALLALVIAMALSLDRSREASAHLWSPEGPDVGTRHT